ncbi:phytanoyl-CoA dioxygenase family protein [Streptantibioticus rubrisoli]|uniref:Phytanoyl-CoA dioxygenase family protein n=1 Tax=Streptantibioticus rubrisoli TaxID=1387313 RepID=A0ABT1PID7_9ACTN|nr:phytanoyl-CoA dioxygenase family protein [Streptantibioticus rubrisoli]MCQ4045131.1 phytanoyl-CoA dioxygenase family protein [Streptantibioticus rubrisoli]
MVDYPGLTAEEVELLPSEEDVRLYSERGWYLSEKLLSDAETEALTEASERYYAGQRGRQLPMRPDRLADWTPADGDVQRNNDYIHYQDETIAGILRKPVIGAVAASLAQTDLIRTFQATLIYKPPIAEEASNIVSWHFDKYFWPTCSSGKMLTAFIPFHDCTEESGTITMVNGSHRWSHRHRADRPVGDPEDLGREYLLNGDAEKNEAVVEKVPVHIPKGHMTFHHCLLYHGSGANRSPRPRRAISLHLQDGTNSYRDHSLSTGRQTPYKHDSLVRRTAAGLPDYTDPEICPVLWPVPVSGGGA